MSFGATGATNANAPQASLPDTSSSAALVKGLGGLLARHAAARREDSRSSGSLMETTVEVTSFSSAPLDPRIFQVPAGYKRLQMALIEGNQSAWDSATDEEREEARRVLERIGEGIDLDQKARERTARSWFG